MFSRGMNAHRVAALFKNPTERAEHGLTAIFNRTTVWRQFKKLSWDMPEVIAEREKWESSINDIELVSRKNRLNELQKFARDERLDAKTRMAAIEQIRRELSEDVQRIAEAIQRSGTVVNVGVVSGRTDLDNRPEGERDEIRRNIADAYRW
jgi:hypothetical protein